MAKDGFEGTNNINAKDEYGRTELHRAASGKNLAKIKNLLFLGADVDSRNEKFQTPLINIAQECSNDSYFEVMKMLLENGANVDAQDTYGFTPLHHLAFRSFEKKNDKSLQLLFDYKADANIRNQFGESALFRAAIFGDVRFAEKLVNYGSVVNFVSTDRKKTPLHYAFISQNLELIKFLLRNGANIEAADHQGRTPSMQLFSTYSDEKIKKKLVLFLLKYSDANTINSEGKNILSFEKPSAWKTMIEHFAKIQEFNLPVHSKILETISGDQKYKDYFEQCKSELLNAKICKLKDSWLTYFDLLEDDKRKLKNYAGNKELIYDFKNSDCLNKFTIYEEQMQKNVEKGITRRGLFDMSSITLSNCLPIFNPSHLIIRDIFDCISTKDLTKYFTM